MWLCSDRRWADGSRCDCGCGAIDPDCETPGLDSCDDCDSPGSCSGPACPGTIEPEYNGYCRILEPPEGWTCEGGAYADGISCDCGCGLRDPTAAATTSRPARAVCIAEAWALAKARSIPRT